MRHAFKKCVLAIEKNCKYAVLLKNGLGELAARIPRLELDSLLIQQVIDEFALVPEAAQRVHALQHVRIDVLHRRERPHGYLTLHGRMGFWLALTGSKHTNTHTHTHKNTQTHTSDLYSFICTLTNTHTPTHSHTHSHIHTHKPTHTHI